MAYASVQGIIKSISRTGKQIKLDDENWYSAFNEKQLRGARQGDEVEFDYEAKEQGGKTFLNIKGDVRIVGGDAPPARQERSPARSSAPAQRSAPQAAAPREGFVSDADRQNSIQRQVALKAAVELAAARLAADPSTVSDFGVGDIIDWAEDFTKFLDGK